MSGINPGGVITSKDKFTLVDVRTLEEFSRLHIPGSLHIPIDILEQNLFKIPKDRPIVCICRSGNRSDTASLILLEKGLEARNLSGGILAWTQTELEKGLIDDITYRERIKQINWYE